MEKQIFNPVIMAGGVGSRLWPLSRASMPKQFQALLGNEAGHSMLQQTSLRLVNLDLASGQIICNQDHRFLAAEQMRAIEVQVGEFDVVLEPCGRNTAPAVLVAALRLLAKGDDHPMLLLAADHAIANEAAFTEALLKAHALACSGMVVTLGITPTFACTGYGYIRQGTELSQGYLVADFVEKPNLAVANKYLSSGDYLWNSGMFIAKPSVLVEEARQFCPGLLVQCEKVVDNSFSDLDFVRLPEAEFNLCQDISIDYAIMEHTKKAAVVPMDCGWSDVGDLAALKEANRADANGNVFLGDVEAINTQNCLVQADNKLVATLGVTNLAIVETKDALLVADLSHSQHVKDIVGRLKDREEIEHHREVFRPWGCYDSIDIGNNYQVKRITVKPGAKLSLQRHKQRAEHWVVVAGIATVHLDGAEYVLEANSSIYIPKTSVHSLANNTDTMLHLIEVQSGSYLGEDDIERLEDLYGRS